LKEFVPEFLAVPAGEMVEQGADRRIVGYID